jgi:hypothetical protein
MESPGAVTAGTVSFNISRHGRTRLVNAAAAALVSFYMAARPRGEDDT